MATRVLYILMGFNKEVMFPVLEGLQQEGYTVAPIFTNCEGITDTVHRVFTDKEAYFTNDFFSVYNSGEYISGIRVDSLLESDIVFAENASVLEDFILKYTDRRIFSIHIGDLTGSDVSGYEMNLYVTTDQVTSALSYVKSCIRLEEEIEESFSDANYAVATDALIKGLYDLDHRDLEYNPLKGLISDHWNMSDKGISKSQVLGSFFSHFHNSLVCAAGNIDELIAVLSDNARVLKDRWDEISERKLARNMLSIIAAGMGIMTELGYDIDTMLNNEVTMAITSLSSEGES